MAIDGTGSSELIFNILLSAWQKVTLEIWGFFSSVKQDLKLNLDFVHIQGFI